MTCLLGNTFEANRVSTNKKRLNIERISVALVY